MDTLIIWHLAGPKALLKISYRLRLSMICFGLWAFGPAKDLLPFEAVNNLYWPIATTKYLANQVSVWSFGAAKDILQSH